MNDDTPHPSDSAADAENLRAAAKANADATWGDTDAGRSIVPGIVSGDLGPKGTISAQLRGLSRSERATYGQIPHGTNLPGTGRLLLALMLGIALIALALALVIVWLAT